VFEIARYQRDDGTEPFTEWYRKLRNGIAKAAIALRLDRLKAGNFGDCKSVGTGVQELRIHTGPGYRVYFGIDRSTLIILLVGGDKSTQTGDISRARALWAEWRRRQP